MGQAKTDKTLTSVAIIESINISTYSTSLPARLTYECIKKVDTFCDNTLLEIFQGGCTSGCISKEQNLTAKSHSLWEARRICEVIIIRYYYSLKISPHFCLVKTTPIYLFIYLFHHTQLVLTIFGKNLVILSRWRQKFCHIEPMTSFPLKATNDCNNGFKKQWKMQTRTHWLR